MVTVITYIFNQSDPIKWPPLNKVLSWHLLLISKFKILINAAFVIRFLWQKILSMYKCFLLLIIVYSLYICSMAMVITCFWLLNEHSYKAIKKHYLTTKLDFPLKSELLNKTPAVLRVEKWMLEVKAVFKSWLIQFFIYIFRFHCLWGVYF